MRIEMCGAIGEDEQSADLPELGRCAIQPARPIKTRMLIETVSAQDKTGMIRRRQIAPAVKAV